MKYSGVSNLVKKERPRTCRVFTHEKGSVCVLTSLLLLTGASEGLLRMDVVHSWGQCDFVYESDGQRLQLLRSGALIPGNAIPFDVDVDTASRRVFLAVPALLPGSPVALATIADPQQLESPRLAPYPNWSWHANAYGCDGFTSVFRIHVDECRRLWAVDCGATNILRSPHCPPRCPPRLLVFDLASDRLLRRHRLPGSLPVRARPQALVVEQLRPDCSTHAYAYIADPGAFQLLVYSLHEDRSWWVQSALFYPDVGHRMFHVGDVSFELMDGLLGLSLSPALSSVRGPQEVADRLLFFHAFSSVQEGYVRTAVLRNSSNFPSRGGNLAADAFRLLGSRPSQCAAEAMSEDGIQFFSEWSDFTIRCWNSRMPYSERFFGVVEHDKGIIRVATGIKSVHTGRGSTLRGELATAMAKNDEEEVWVLTNNAHLLFNGTFCANVSNSVHVLRGRKSALIAGTVCVL